MKVTIISQERAGNFRGVIESWRKLLYWMRKNLGSERFAAKTNTNVSER